MKQVGDGSGVHWTEGCGRGKKMSENENLWDTESLFYKGNNLLFSYGKFQKDNSLSTIINHLTKCKDTDKLVLVRITKKGGKVGWTRSTNT